MEIVSDKFFSVFRILPRHYHASMVSILILLICLVIGVGLQKVKTLPANAHSTLGTLILYVALPAVCLLSLPDLEWDPALLSLCLVTWIIFAVAFFIFPFLGKKYGWDKGLVGCLILTAGFCNSAFVGFPVIEALYGKEALKHAVLLDQSGSFLIVSSFGIWIALTYSSGKMRKRVLVKKIFLFPPFLAFLIGISLGVLGWRAEGDLRQILERLANLLTPMALICVGLQLHWNHLKAEAKYLFLGLSYKLLVAPALILVIYSFLDLPVTLLRVSVLEAGMAPMITSSILAATHDLRPRLAGMMVGVGVPLSFLTLVPWYFILNSFN
jgi:predicted permease